MLLGATVGARADVVLDEDFTSIGDWDDLSRSVTWGGHSGATSAFTTSGGAVHLVRSGSDSTVGYTGYASADDLKTFTALDRRFPAPISHASSTITIDLRARWDKLDFSGEKGRLMVVLNYAYPAGGLDLDLDDRYDDLNQPHWARPAYHVRIRSAGTGSSQGTTLLQYGGGLTDLGEYEQYGTSWWLPGFISGAGGVSPGTAPDFPQNSWTSTDTGLATTQFRSYRYVVKPDQQEIWFDDGADGFTAGDLEAVMPLPSSSSAPLYRYFETFEGIRLYWRGAGSPSDGDPGQVFVDHLTVTVETTGAGMCGNGVPDSGEPCDDGNTDAGDCCSPTCQYEPTTTVCRTAAGTCDAAETCTGIDGTCPADAFEPPTTECRAAAGVCDVAETCSGNGPDCPDDQVLDGVPCPDGDLCNGDETCVAGSCAAGVPLSCDDGQFCNGPESCDPDTGCVPGTPPPTADPVACTLDWCDEVNDAVVHTPDDALCEDGDACTAESCDAVTGCVYDPVPACAARIPTAGTRGRAILVLLLLAAGGIGLGRRRRPRAFPQGDHSLPLVPRAFRRPAGRACGYEFAAR